MNEDVLLHGFTITRVMDCIADPTKNRIIAELSDEVDAVFPYLNAVVPNLMDNAGANTITVKRGERVLTFYPPVAVMAKVNGVDDAVAQLIWFKDLYNEVWRRRVEIPRAMSDAMAGCAWTCTSFCPDSTARIVVRRVAWLSPFACYLASEAWRRVCT